MYVLDQQFGKGSQDELHDLLSGSGLTCLVDSYWHYPDVRQVYHTEERPDDADGVVLTLSWYANMDSVARAHILFYDAEPSVVYWEDFAIQEDHRSKGLFEWVWTQWPIKWAQPRGITKIRILSVDGAIDLFRHCGLVDDSDRGIEEPSPTALKGEWGIPEGRMGQYIAWKTGKGDKPSYLDDPAA